MSFTIAETQELYNTSKSAYLAALKGKQYSISTAGTNRAFSRQEITNLKTDMEYWCNLLADLQSGTGQGNKIRFGKPLKV